MGQRDYIDGIEYINGAIDFVTTEEGRANKSSAYIFEYFLKDHLGNTRATVKQDGSINQIQDYYAFGMDMNNGYTSLTSPDNKYKYNGKELDGELGFNMYDYGARFYDPVIARWTTVDPLAEKSRRFSPYNYVMNNPIRFIDPDGMESASPEELQRYQDIYAENAGISRDGSKRKNGGASDEQCCKVAKDQNLKARPLPKGGLATGRYIIVNGRKRYLSTINTKQIVRSQLAGSETEQTEVATFDKAEGSTYLSAQYNDYSKHSTNLTLSGMAATVAGIPFNPAVGVAAGLNIGLSALYSGSAQDAFKKAGDGYTKGGFDGFYLIKTETTNIQTIGGEASVSGSLDYKFYQPSGQLFMEIHVKN